MWPLYQRHIASAERPGKKRWSILARHQAQIYNPTYHRLKRWFDISTVLLTMPLTLPVSLLLSVLIWLEDGRPVLFIQERIGKGGKRFNIYKFRTMHQNIDRGSHQSYMADYIKGNIEQDADEKKVFKPFSAKQVTRIGAILRKTSLDELPQLYNVLRGEMSLVGPRPNVPWEVEAYLEWHKERLEVLPGITGLAQIRGRSGLLFDNIVNYDIEYIKYQSFELDMRILFLTVAHVFMGDGSK